MHGYQLMEELEGRGFVQPRRLESGAVYTILRRMEKRGLLESRWERVETGPDRRVYRVTDTGVDALKAGLETMVKRKALMEDLAAFYREQFQKQEGA
jgi:PadR family transcriptional regulator PadR